MNGQTPVIIPSHTHVGDHDPNMRKNRIPTESELSGLKGIANTLTKSIQDMEEDITRAQEAHESLLAKYQQQFQELEGTQSQLHESKELIEFLQKQCRNFKVKSDRLSGIIHPIRRCPTDVLQSIFELACQMSKSTHIIRTAVRLSHVCQRWRTIAVDTPRLWCRVTFSLLRGISHRALFWDTIIHRMRHAPANIALFDLDEVGSTRFKQYKLQRIPVISSLMLDLMDPDYFSEIKSLPRFLPSSGVKHLKIQNIPPEDMPDGLDIEAWDIGDLLENLPPVRELELNCPWELIITPSAKLATITRLRLEGMVNVDVLSTILLLPNLSHLDLHDVGFSPIETTQVVSNSLKFLKMENSEAESWLEWLICPNLDTFLAGCMLNLDLYTRFVQVHTSITHLDIHGFVGNFVNLASVASQVQTLVIDSDLSPLYKRRVPRLKGIPFPSLARLIVDTLEMPMTLDDFEGVIRARCLPRGHRLSKLTTPLGPLAALSIRRDPSDPEEESWRESELFRSAKKTVEWDPHWDAELLTLSWV